MKIFVINGSPKGENSITLQTVKYIELKNPQCTFSYLHAGQYIRQLEKDFLKAAEQLREADVILFAYPVYTFLVPSQLHRFVELIKENGVALQGKFVSQISTSKHFYDITAHKFIEQNCQDLGMKVVRGLSADMEDLLSPKGRKDAETYFKHLLYCVDRDVCLPFPIVAGRYEPVKPTIPEHVVEKGEKKVVIVADLQPKDHQLNDMIERFMRVIPLQTEVVNIREFPFQGGCLGCFRCAGSGKCVYKDAFDEYLRANIQTADAIVIAFSIQDHSMGSRFKMYDDRQFCNGHRAVTMGTPFGYLISGGLCAESNLRNVIDARAEVGGNYLAGVATDEQDPDHEIDMLANNLIYAVKEGYTQPADFWGVGGMKIFRDLIWQMRGMMKADHRFYKQHKLYDFPQKKWPQALAMYLVGALVSNPKLMAKAGNKMTEGMLAPYKKVMEREAGK